MWVYNNLDELYHYGILGMRWGRRKAKASTDHTRTKALKKKKLSQMSNKELKEYNERRNLERTYKSFDQSVIKKGAATLATTAAIMGSVLYIKNNSPEIVKMGQSAVSKLRNIRL